MSTNSLAALAMIAGLHIAALPAACADEASDVNARIENLESELALLKRQVEVDKEVAQTNADKFATVELGPKGLVLSSPDKNLTVGLRAYGQFDSRLYLGDDKEIDADTFLARRVRPILEGTFYKDFSFRIMEDFAGSSAQLFDAYVDYRLADAVRFRAGKFKTPVGLERLQSATDTFFIERGLPTNLVPTRDVGFQVFGDVIPETLEYQLGVFNGVADLANGNTDVDDRKDIAARVFTHPFRRSDNLLLQGLGIGIGGSSGGRVGSPTQTILPEYRSPGQQTVFRYRSGSAGQDAPTFAAATAYADGRETRIAPQAYWYYNQFGFLGEWGRTIQHVTRGPDSTRLNHDAWQAVLSWVITGEDAGFKGGVKPARRFDPANGGWGAFQLSTRIGALNLDDDSFPVYADINRSVTKESSAGLDLNWYLNDFIELWASFDYTTFDGGAANGSDREDERALFMRAQFKL